MTALRTAAQQALEVLDEADTFHRNLPDQRARRLAAMAALRAALAQPAEPAREWVSMDEYKRLQGLVTSQGIRLMEYDTAPPQRLPLTEEEIERIARDCLDAWSCTRAVERAHGIKE